MMNWTTTQSAEFATIAACFIAAISILGLALAALWNARIRNADLRQREFENYHRLIRDLAIGGEQIRLASQTAIIFELRNYPKYATISARILRALQEEWTREGKTRHSEEMDLTIPFLERIKANQ